MTKACSPISQSRSPRMESPNFSSQLRRSILVHSTMGILTIGLTVSIVSIAFFYFNLRSELIDKLAYSLRIKSMTVDEFSNRAQDITLQITSRTKIREKLEEFNRGEIRREQLASFSAPLLADAMRQSSEIAGISRLDAKGELTVSIGIPIPPAVWPIPETTSGKVRFRGPLILEGNSYLVLGAAIIGQENRRAGTDIVLFNTEKLQEFLKDYTGLGKRGETILGLPGNGGINLLVPLRAEMKRRHLAAPIVLFPTAPLAEALRSGLAKKKGPPVPDSPSIIAYGPPPP